MRNCAKLRKPETGRANLVDEVLCEPDVNFELFLREQDILLMVQESSLTI